jgi:alkanesulfonate monooxygenase SsuD/methylene tetrahydromethanopterin reductase-like flavin-dependent oxidoreductase (luciferase family)
MVTVPEFGVGLDPLAAVPSWPATLAAAADRLDLDLVGVQDHPYQRRFLDTWTLVATLVPVTQRIRFFPDVANLPLRPPAVLAKAAASLDLLSGGRVELGLGAGGYAEAAAAMGGPARRPADALAALDEAIDVIRLMWSDQRPVRFAGRHYRLDGAQPGPRPAHDIGIWVGGYGPRMLELIGRKADGWVPSSPHAPPDVLPERQRRIDEAAAAAGRDPATIRRVYNVLGAIEPAGAGPFHGPVGYWVDELVRLTVEVGMTGYVFWPAHDQVRQLETFAGEVVPAVRAAVAARGVRTGQRRGGA